MPDRSTVVGWVVDDREGFASQYARAKAVGIDEIVDEAIEIADTPVPGVIETDKQNKDGTPFTEVRRADMIEHRRLQVDTRKWYAAKLAPKLYGDRLQHADTDVEGNPMNRDVDDSTLVARIDAIYATAARRRLEDELRDLV